MKVFADHCVHTDLVEALRTEGLDVVRAMDVDLAAASDMEIFRYIIDNGLVLLTFDKDFGNVSDFDPEDTCGIVVVYVERMSSQMMIEETTGFFKRSSSKTMRGGLFAIELGRVRRY